MMLESQLPQLPKVEALDGNSFESVFICYLIARSGPVREFDSSQRQILSIFNRSQQRSISKKLKKAQEQGFLKKVRKSEGLLADVYTRGHLFEKETSTSMDLITLSNSLWGTNGLLYDWPYPEAWGFGCVKTGVLLCLATLRKLDGNISKKTLRKYLQPLVSQSSFNEAIRILTERHMVVHTCGGIVLSTDWENKLEHWLATSPACNQRKEKGEIRRKAEQVANRMRVRKRELAEADRVLLLSLPCVVKGCDSKEREMEHFPPRRFLKDLDVETNRHFVWSICKDHNLALSRFIKKMPLTNPIPPAIIDLSPGVDPLRIYSTAANFGLTKFYRALRIEKDEPVTEVNIEIAHQAVVSVLSLWKAIQLLPHEIFSNEWKSEGSGRTRGKNPHLTSESQLPIHPN
jgi:hypothetical protein